jgi:hypothetical protein
MKNKIYCFIFFGILVITFIIPSFSGNIETKNNDFENEPWNGYTLFSPMYSKNTYLININKEIVHVWESQNSPGMAVYLLENGNIMRTKNLLNQNFLAGGTGGGVQEIAPDGTVIWDFEYSDNNHCSHHDIEILPNGNILMIAWEIKSYSQAIAAGRDPDLIGQNIIWSEHIIEVEPTGSNSGNIVWEWNVWDHLIQDFDSSKNNYGNVAEHPELIDINFMGSPSPDWLHINSIDYNEDLDQILLSVNYLSEFWVIRHGGNSDILYRWGNPQTYRAGNNNNQKISHIHDAQWIKNGLPGAGNILYFNNGVDRVDGRFSSVEEIQPPLIGDGYYEYSPGLPFNPEEQTWIYGDNIDNNFFSEGQSGAQRLPNGNTLICEADDGRFFEINKNGTTIWEYINPYPTAMANHVFKINRYKPDYPGLIPLLDNFHPNDPVIPEGPISGFIYENYLYSTRTIDPDNDDVQYGWDWNNDNVIDDWSDFYNSGELCNMSHSWKYANDYNIKVKARDVNDDESDWSQPLTVSISIHPSNYPPDTPSIPSGPVSGVPGVSYNYNTKTIDPDGDEIYYLFDWGDGSYSNWIGPYQSGERANCINSWGENDTYSVRVKAKDVYGFESEWSDPLTVIMPRSKFILMDLFIQLFEQYPFIFNFLQLFIS